MKKGTISETVIYFPHLSDREARENYQTQLAAIISQTFPDRADSSVNLRIFNHSTIGMVPLRTSIPHMDDVKEPPYWAYPSEIFSTQDKATETNEMPLDNKIPDDEGADTGTQEGTGELKDDINNRSMVDAGAGTGTDEHAQPDVNNDSQTNTGAPVDNINTGAQEGTSERPQGDAIHDTSAQEGVGEQHQGEGIHDTGAQEGSSEKNLGEDPAGINGAAGEQQINQ